MQAKKMTHGLKKLTSAIKFSHLAYAGLIAGQVISHNAQAAPEGGVVVGGDGSITAQDLTTIIDQKTDLLAIDWDSFNLTEEELVKFLQPNSSSIVLNRILDQNPSTIRGAIESNGHVILANPRGVLFTETATVNVGAITAAGLDMDSSGFMNGDFSFRGQDGSTGVVVNRGLINAASAVLVGKQVTNASSGLISADMVSLAAADEAVLTFDTDGMIGVKVTKEVMENQLGIDSAVLNEGAIEGAQVLMDAKVSGGLFTSAVNNKGTVLARGIDTSGGTIRLTGSGSAVVNSGTLDASGSNGGQVTLDGDSATHSGQIVARGSSGQGGQVKVLGDTVTVSGDIDARGRAAGGEVLVGGDYQGKNERVRNAETTVVTAEAEIDASGIGDGNGGRVIVWADDSTHFAGSIRAESGVLGGDGGFVETSGKVNLHLGEATMSVSTLSLAGGDTGTWLLDPGWLEIMADADCTENCVSVVALAAALNNNNVTITVSASETDPVNYSSTVDDASGNAAVNENNPDYSNGILVSSDLSWDSGNTLTLTSHNQVQIAANVTIDAVSGANAGHLAVNADGDFTNLGSVLVSDFSLDLGGSFVNSGIVSVENLNLNVGNTGADTFNTLGDITVSTSGTVVGGSGTDTVDTVDGITWTLGTVDGSASAAGIDFSNIEQVDTANAIVDGSSNGVTEAFDLTDGTLNVLGIDFTAAAEAKAGAETDDSVTSNATSWKLVGNKSVTAGAVTFSGIDSVTTNSATLNGTANADEFSVDGSGTITSYDIQFSGFSVVNAGANGVGKDTVDTIPDGLTWILGTVDGSASAAGIDFTGIEQVDTANAIVDGSSNGVTETFDLTDGTLNVLGIDFTAAAEAKAGAETDDSVTSNATSWTLVGNKSVTAGAVTFSGIDSVTTNSATLNGTANADEFSVDGSGNITSYEIQFSGLSVVNAGANGVGKDTVDTITDGLTWTLGTVDGSASAAGIDFTGIEQVDTANAIVDGINNDIAESFDLTDGILNVLGIDFTAASEAKAGAETDDSVTSNAASWTLEGNRSATAGAVTFSGIDSVTTNSATLNGTDNADEFSVDGSGNVTSYDIQFAGLSAINAGADSGGLDTVDASGADIQLNGADGEARVRNIDFTGIEEATNGNLVTSNNGDRFVVTGADSIKA
ncbi:filamentous hemagglutinin family N-terminal domain-containing protein, partial [Microbulbifer donghaiensis]